MKNDRKATRLNFLQAVFFGVLAIVLLGAADPSRAAFAGVQNGGFETPAISGAYQSLPPGSAGLSPWVISGDSVGVYRYASGAVEGTQWIDLQATTGKILQTLQTTPGATYKLSFKYTTQIGSSPKVNVTWGPAGNPSLNEKFTSSKNWVTAERTVTATSESTVLSFAANGDGNNSYGVQLDAVSVTELSAPLATPSLLGVIGIGNAGATAYVVGRVDSITTPTALTVEASTCGSSSAPIGSYTTTTDKYGFFLFQIKDGPNLGLGKQVKVRIITPQITDDSNCVLDSADNDYWPKALSLDGVLTAQDYIDIPGRGRWYKFTVKPSQSVRVKLSGLPADYDLAVFKDIGQAFKGILAPNDSAELLKLSAEFAPSVSQSIFSQSIFSQSIFSQSIFSQSIFSQSIFSQSIFSQSIFSQSIFSQSIFSQSIFSQSIFSQSIFSQSIFSQSIFSQSIFSPTCDPNTSYCYFKGLDAGATVDQIAQAYSAAQSQTLVGVSATPGTADELVVLNTWNNTGEYYIRVSGRNGASDPVQPFTITVTPDGANVCEDVTPLPSTTRSAVTGAKTVFVTDTSLLDLGGSFPVPGANPPTTETLGAKLNRIMGRTEVNGVLVDVKLDQRVKDLKAQAAARPLCAYAQNLVAQEIKSVIDRYRSGLNYVVILGNDATVPFFRYPDRSLLGEEFNYVPPLNPNSPSDASLRGNYVLSQDAYGSSKFLALPNGDFPIPGLAVGRLVETPAEIAGMLDAYEATHGVIAPRSSLVTGYDFLADAATEVASQLGAGTGSAVDKLITNSGVPPSTVGDPPLASWTADHLRAKLFGPRHDVVYLAGHFSANNALAADYTSTIVTTELAASTVDLRNSLIFSAGCHSGYNLVDADGIPGVTLNLDWAQAFAQKGATLIAGTGYQYGDTDFLEYSERLYTNFSRQLRTGTGNIPVGDALVRAKLDYLAATPDIRGIHEKALLEATLFGMPMLGVNMLPTARLTAPLATTGVTPIPVTTGAAAQVTGLLATYQLSLQDGNGGNMVLKPHSKVLQNLGGGDDITAEWLSGQNDSDVVTNPIQPTLPLVTVNVTPPASSGLVLRGIGFLGGTYTDKAPMYPLSGAPTTEQSSVHLAFQPTVFNPNVLSTPNYFGALTGTGGTSLLVTPVQHKGYDVLQGTSVERKFSHLDLKLYYSNRTGVVATSAGATIGSVNATSDGANGVVFTAQVLGDPNAGIQDVWVTYTKDDGVWALLPLANCVTPLPAACGTSADSRIWAGSLPNVSRARYVVQAATATGLVSLDSNQGAYYLYGFAAPVATTLQILSAQSPAVFGATIPVTVELKTASGTPLVGKSVLVALGGGGTVATTQAGGTVAVNVPVIGVVPSTTPAQVTASFYGEDALLGSSATALLASSSAVPVTVAKASTALTPASVVSPNVGATLKTGSLPLPQRSVRFTFDGTRGQAALSVVAITNNAGTAIAGPPAGLIPDTYTVTARFPATDDPNSDPTYTASSVVLATGAYDVARYDQTITVPDGQLPTAQGCTGYCAPYGSTFTFAPTASSGGMVTVAAADACSNVGTTVTMTSGTGSCNLTATQAGTPDYVQQTLTVTVVALKIDQTITFGALADKTLGNPDFAVSAMASSGLAVSLAASGNCTVSGNIVHITGAGSCTITASQGGGANYNPAPDVPQTFNIGKATPTFTWSGGDGTFSGSPQGPTATAAGDTGVVVNMAYVGVAPTSYAGPGKPTNAGTYLATASYPDSTNYKATTDTRAFTIGKVTPTFTWSGGDGTFTGSPQGPTATAAGDTGVVVNMAYSGVAPTSYAGPGKPTNAGTYLATAGYPDSTNYKATTDTKAFTIGKATLTVSGSASGAPAIYGDDWTTAGVSYAYTSPPSGTLACLLGTMPTSFAAPSFATSPLNAGTYSVPVTPLAASLVNLTSCNEVDLTVGFTVASATSKFTLADAYYAPAGTTANLSVSGKLNRDGKPAVYPKNGDVAGFTVTLMQGTTTVKTYSPFTNLGAEGAFTIADTVPLGAYTLTFKYTPPALGAPTPSYTPLANFTATGPVTRALRIEGFIATSSMLQARRDHSATLLNDGRVLVVGGLDASGSPTATSELYCPTASTVCPAAAVGKFTASGNLPSKSAGHTATLLPSGKVVAIGGGNSSAQIFDPVTKVWASAGGLTGRSYHTATLLGNGKVLVAGGIDNSGKTIQSTLIFDPATGGTTNGPTMLYARERHTAALLTAGPNAGKVLFAGGRQKSGNGYVVLSSAELYDPAANTVGPASPMVAGRFSHATANLGDGRVVVAGGSSATGATVTSSLSRVEIYGPVAGTWTWTALDSSSDLWEASGRREFTLTRLGDGRLLAAGGVNATTARLASSELFTPNAFNVGAAMAAARSGHTATLLPDGRVLVVGGAGTSGSSISGAELYNGPPGP